MGTPKGRALLFLHGGLGSLEDFEPLLGALADFRCVLMDSRGHGGSTLGSEPLTYERLALDAEAVIEAHRLERPVILGHSDGGITAIRIAAARRCPLGGIVTLGAHEDPPGQELREGIFAHLTASSWRNKFPDGVALYERLNPVPDFDRLFTATLAMWQDMGAGNYPGALAESIECPALILGGDADDLVSRNLTVKLAARIPGASLGILPFGDHMVFQSRPERVVPYVRQFIETFAA